MATTQRDDVFNSHLIQVANLADLSIEQLRERLIENNFLVLRGLINKDLLKQAVNQLRTQFDSKKDHPSCNEDPRWLKGNFQKLAIGGFFQTGVYRPRFIRTIYNPLCAPDCYGLHQHFQVAITLRNRLLGLHDHFAATTVENGVWTPARIHQYPRGGGFLVKHRDTVLSSMAQKKGMEYFQLVMILSEYGHDFHHGGGFITTKENEEFLYEPYTQLGDIVVYNGQSSHGVKDIDPDQLVDLTTLNGRLSALFTLYKDINKDQISDLSNNKIG